MSNCKCKNKYTPLKQDCYVSRHPSLVEYYYDDSHPLIRVILVKIKLNLA